MAAQLEHLKKYLTQAKKFDEISPLIAYFCRLHAMERAAGLERSPQVTAFTNEIFSLIEQADESIIMCDKAKARDEIMEFSMKLLERANEQDRAGQATKKTLNAFYTSYVLMDVLAHFGPIAPDIAHKLKFAKGRATDIAKALREARTPKPDAPRGFDVKETPQASDDYAAANSTQQTTPSMSPRHPPATSVRSQTSQRSSEAPTLPERRKVDEALPTSSSSRLRSRAQEENLQPCSVVVSKEMLADRLREYKMATVQWKQAGDLDKARKLFKKVKLMIQDTQAMEIGLDIWIEDLPPAHPRLPPGASYIEKQASTAPERQKAEEVRTASSSSRLKSGVGEETFQTSHAVDAKGCVGVERDANLLLPPAAYPEKQGSGSGHSSGAGSRTTASPQDASSGAVSSGMASPQQVEDLIKQYNNAAVDARNAGDKVKAIEYLRQMVKYEKARDSGRTLTTGSHSRQTLRSPEKSATHVHRPTHSKNTSGSTSAASATHNSHAYVRLDSPLMPSARSSSVHEATVGQSSDGRNLVDSPKDMKLREILESLNLLHWLPTLRDERVDEEVFMELSEEDLLGLNFKKLGERRRFLKWQKISKTSSRIENENQMKYELAPKKEAPPPLAVQKKVTHSSVDLSDLTCPITLELMKNPVILFADGHTYEKEALDQWFATGRRSSPVTGVNIVSTNYETNWAVKKFVRKYLEENPQFKKHAQSHVDELNSYRAACALRERDLEMAAAKLEGLRIDNDELKMKAYKSDEILAAVQKVGAQVDAGFASLSMRLSQLGLEIFSRLPGGNVPRLFVVLPEQWFSGQSGRFARMRGVFTSQWRVLPLCEGNDTFSECHVNPYHDGYRISMTRPWLRKALPVIKVALKVVCIGIQAGSAGAINLGPLANLLPSDPKAVVELSNALSRSVGMLEDNLQHKSITSLLQDEDLMRSGSAELANLLSGEFDKTAGLQQMYNGANQVLWVCRDHTRGLIGVNRN